MQRELQETGHTFWRPSLKEKQEAMRRPEGLRPPSGKKIYYRDVHLPELLVFRPMGQSHTEDVTRKTDVELSKSKSKLATI